MSEFKKRGTVKVTNGKYLKDGVEKTRYVTVGEYFSSDHGNRQAIKLYATAFSDEKWLNIYLEEEVKHDDRPITQTQVLDEARKDELPDDGEVDKPISLSDIPF